MDFQVTRAQSANPFGHQADEEIVARREVEIDGADGDLGLARDHLDRGAVDAVSSEDLGGGGEDGFAPREPLAFLALAYTHAG
jgi:hypothetical protein